MSKRLKIKFQLHRIVIVLFCLALLAALMQGITYFSLNGQATQAKQAQALARTLAKQVTFSLVSMMDEPTEESDEPQIRAILRHVTENSRVLDASVYRVGGALIAQEGEQTGARERLAIDNKGSVEPENQQIVEMIEGKDGPLGFVRLTLDTHVSKAETAEQKKATNMLRLMLVLAAAVGFILARALLARRLEDKLTAAPAHPESTSTEANNPTQPKKKRPHKKKPYR